MHYTISMKLRFMEIEEERAKADDLCRSGLRSRCLPFLPGDHSVKEAAVRPVETNAINKQREKNPMKDETIVERAPRRRIVRPTSMLRPTVRHL